jgi:hypothetical protein
VFFYFLISFFGGVFMFDNRNDIAKRLGEKSRELAELFDQIAKRILEKSFEEEGEREYNRRSKQNNRKFPLFKDPYITDIAEQFDSNLIPSDYKGSCRKYCLAFAFDKWGGKVGFKNIANDVMALWFECFQINQVTLIFSYAWDELDFIQCFKNHFDNYSHQGKTICVVLVTDEGFSIQYLR